MADKQTAFLFLSVERLLQSGTLTYKKLSLSPLSWQSQHAPTQHYQTFMMVELLHVGIPEGEQQTEQIHHMHIFVALCVL